MLNANLVVAGHVNACVTGPTGTVGNAYACALDRALTSPSVKACYSFVADTMNTGPATIAFSSPAPGSPFGAIAISKVAGGVNTPLVSGDIRSGALVTVCYDGTSMQCQNCSGNVGAPVNLATGVTGRLPYVNLTAPSVASLLLGRGATTGDWQEITLGTNLSMSGATLNATGGGGSGISGATPNALLVATSVTTATSLADATNGQLPIGSTGAAPVLATLTGTTNQISVTNAAGSITLAIPTNPTLPGTTTGTFSGPLTGNASTATALAANGANCGAGQLPRGVDTVGAAEGCAPVSLTADVSGRLPYANVVAPSTTSLLLGRGTTAGDWQEVTLGTNLSMTGAQLNAAAPPAGLGDPGTSGLVVRTALNTTVARALVAGSGIGGSNLDGTAGNPTLTTDSTKAGFLAAGALTCGAATAGKAQVSTTPLQYCDNAATPALQYAAYGTSAGAATSVAAAAITDAALSAPVTVPKGGTGLSVGTSGGLPYFASTTTMASSALLTANALLLGGGAGAAPTALGSLGTTTTVLHGNAAGAPTFAGVSLTADVAGRLPYANITLPSTTSLLLGRGVTGGDWQEITLGTNLSISGTTLNAAAPPAGLADPGGNGLVVRTALNTTSAVTTSAGIAAQISDETGTGALVFGTSPTLVTPTIASFTNATHTHTNAAGGGQLTDAALSAAVTVPKGGTGLTVGTSGGIPYFSTTTAMSSSGLLTANALLLGGGAGAAPTAMASLGTTTTLLHGNAAGAPAFSAVSLTADVTGRLPYANVVAPSTTALLLGRGSTAGDWQEVTLGSGLSMSGTVLSVSAGGGNVSNSGTPLATQLAIWTSASVIKGDPALTFATGTLALGATGTTGVLTLAGTTSGVITIEPQAVAGTYNFNLPTSAGTSGQPLLSGGGLTAAMTFGTLGVGAGGTGLTTGLSGGLLYFSSTTTVASSAALTSNALMLGGGVGSAPAVLGSLGTTTTVLHGNAAGAPTFAAVSLTADVTGRLPYANHVAPSTTSLLLGRGTTAGDWQEITLGTNLSMTGTTLNASAPAALGDPGTSGLVVRTALNTTTARTLVAGSGIGGSNLDGTAGNPTLTTDSTKASFLAAGALTCGAATAGKMQVHTTPLQYCDNAATPLLQYAAYGTNTGAATGVAANSITDAALSTAVTVPKGGTGMASGTSGGILYFASTTTMGSSALLTANALVLGGGAGTAPTVLGSLGTTTTLLHGNATGAPTFAAVSLTADVSGRLPYANVVAPSTTALLLGRGTTSGDWQEITLGSNLSMSGTTLNSSPLAGLGDPGSNGLVVRTALNTTTARTLVAGSGIGGSNLDGTAGNPTLTTDSTKASFLAAGALVCGVGTAGKVQIHTTPLQYCDNASTPVLQYAAYGTSTGAATGVAAAAITDAALSSAVTVPKGGTGLTVGTSGGVPYFASTTTMASSALLTANALMLGGGAGAAPSVVGSLGTTTTVLHGNAAGAPTFAAVSLTADVSGRLPYANHVAPSTTSLLLGRGTTAGDWQEITLGTSLSMSGTTLNASNVGMTDPGANGLVVRTALNTTTARTLVAGSGIGGSNLDGTAGNPTLTTDSTKAAFLAAGALTCGAATAGKVQIHTTPLQYCDNAATPALQYTAYGNSSGAATSVAANAMTDAALSAPVTVAKGGTGMSSGASGGIPYFSSTTTIASSVLLTANALMLGGGAGAGPTVMASLGTTTTLLHGNAAGAPTFSAVSLTADVTGNLPTTNLNAGSGATSTTFWRGDGTWNTPATIPAGASGKVQWNNAGTMAASIGLGVSATYVMGIDFNQTAVSSSRALTQFVDGPILLCTSGASVITLTLPAMSTNDSGWWHLVKVDAGAGSCQLAPNGTENINNVNAAITVTMQYQFADVYENYPTTWYGTLGYGPADRLNSGTSGGIPYFSSATTLASSAALTANALVLGGGAGAAPTVLGSLGTTTTLLHGNAAGAPTFSAVNLAASGDVTGRLPYANVVAPSTSSLLLGRGATAGDWQEVTLGTNLSMSGTTLNAAGGGGGNTVSAKTTAYTVTAADFTASTIFTVASGTPFTLTLPATAPTAGTYIQALNYSTGVLTLGRNGKNINGAALNLVVPGGTSTQPARAYVVSDGTNYFGHVGRVQPAVNTIASSTAMTPDLSLGELQWMNTTVAAGTFTVNAPINGTPVAGQRLTIRLKSTNAQTFAWNAIYRGGTMPCPATSTGGGKNDYIGLLYHEVDAKWDCVSFASGY